MNDSNWGSVVVWAAVLTGCAPSVTVSKGDSDTSDGKGGMSGGGGTGGGGGAGATSGSVRERFAGELAACDASPGTKVAYADIDGFYELAVGAWLGCPGFEVKPPSRGEVGIELSQDDTFSKLLEAADGSVHPGVGIDNVGSWHPGAVDQNDVWAIVVPDDGGESYFRPDFTEAPRTLRIDEARAPFYWSRYVPITPDDVTNGVGGADGSGGSGGSGQVGPGGAGGMDGASCPPPTSAGLSGPCSVPSGMGCPGGHQDCVCEGRFPFSTPAMFECVNGTWEFSSELTPSCNCGSDGTSGTGGSAGQSGESGDAGAGGRSG